MRTEYVLLSDREAAERRARNRWLVAGAIVIWLSGFLIGFFVR